MTDIAGGSMNQKNVHGITPLMDIITYAPTDEAFGLIQSLWKINADVSIAYTFLLEKYLT